MKVLWCIGRKTAVFTRKNFPRFVFILKTQILLLLRIAQMSVRIYRLKSLTPRASSWKLLPKAEALYTLMLSSHRNATTNSHTVMQALTSSLLCHSYLSCFKRAWNGLHSVKHHTSEIAMLQFWIVELDKDFRTSIHYCFTSPTLPSLMLFLPEIVIFNSGFPHINKTS